MSTLPTKLTCPSNMFCYYFHSVENLVYVLKNKSSCPFYCIFLCFCICVCINSLSPFAIYYTFILGYIDCLTPSESIYSLLYGLLNVFDHFFIFFFFQTAMFFFFLWFSPLLFSKTLSYTHLMFFCFWLE